MFKLTKWENIAQYFLLYEYLILSFIFIFFDLLEVLLFFLEAWVMWKIWWDSLIHLGNWVGERVSFLKSKRNNHWHSTSAELQARIFFCFHYAWRWSQILFPGLWNSFRPFHRIREAQIIFVVIRWYLLLTAFFLILSWV